MAGETLNFAGIEKLWTDNGGAAGWAPLMAGIALAESGGRTAVINNTPATGDYSVGLWQINYYDGLLASRTARYGSPAALAADPNAQAKAAIDLFGGGAGITNWKGDATYNKWSAAGKPQQPSASLVQSWSGSGAAGAAGSSTEPAGGAAATGDTSGNTGTGSASDPTACIIQFPGVAGIGSFCLLGVSEAKAIKGALLLAAGSIMMGLGLFEIVTVAMRASGAAASIKSSPAIKVASQAAGKVHLPTPKMAKATGSSSSASRRSPISPATPRIPADLDGSALDSDERAAYRTGGPDNVRQFRAAAARGRQRAA